MSELPAIGIPSWRQEAIGRLVNVYDDPETADGQPIIKLKRGVGDVERLNVLLDLLSELYPEAAALVRSSKATPKNRLTAVLGRLNEISLEGREFVAINATAYDWRDVEDDDQEEEKPKPKGERKQAPKVDDDYVKQVVKSTEPKPTTRKQTTTKAKTPVKKGPARPTTRTRSK